MYICRLKKCLEINLINNIKKKITNMKKLTFLMCAVLACLLKVNAQEQEPQFVSKEQQNRNVLLEEITGRNCSACPGGHKAANGIVAKNPDRVWAVNVHAGGYSPQTAPNLNTTPGATIMNAFGVESFPTGILNRSDIPANYNKWETAAKTQLAQVAECNVAGQVALNKITRTAKITVEVYYTGDSKETTNYLTVMMLQDSILGSQEGASFNSSQIVNGIYCHMHVLRDIITETWGDEITQTTAGTLVTKEYNYEIPEVIGKPNGVEVDLDNIIFLAFVTEKKQGQATKPVLNVGELGIIESSDEPIFPFLRSFTQEDLITCSKEKKFTANIANAGTEVLTSLKFEVSVNNGETKTEEWTGDIPVYGNVNIDLFAEVPFGGETVNVRIVEANGEPYSSEKSILAKSEEWKQIELGDTQATETFKLELAQDKFGNQITWQVIGHDNKVITKGGPYAVLSESGIKVHEEYFTVNAGECFRFVMEDNVGNGINDRWGEGYYKLYDSKGNLVVESDGKYGFGEYSIIFVHGAMSVEDVTETSYNVYPNPVKDVLTISGEDMKQITVYNALGQMVKSINCNDNTVQINVSDLRNGMYFVNVVNNKGEMSTSKVSVLK